MRARSTSAPRLVAALALAVAVGGAGCAALGVVEDGRSVSWGKANHGGIRAPARLPDAGEGYRVPVRWRERGLRWGTDELVDMIIHVSRRLALEAPGGAVTVADLSPRRGGPSQWHRSHQSGRDVDLVFFVTDEAGRRVDPEDMRHFGADGYTSDDKEARALDPEAKRLVFDVPRNWQLVRALVEYQGTPVQRIFLFRPLIDLLLEHARAIGEPEAVVARAELILTQPGDSAPHDDHMHVRVLCSEIDRAFGCRDYGQVLPDMIGPRDPMMAWAALPAEMQLAVMAPVPAMLALIGLPVLR
ncbi:MAG: penicillin-insensitive murein endopeptidase [Kofleriaceae bacterium]|nr:penicillin-insensitive murein endopeptidase [Kofleriaceae bacterium]MCB9574955.1 penicillin-insensitive murein endopeptidase [Kofleriaceae bacterium]